MRFTNPALYRDLREETLCLRAIVKSKETNYDKKRPRSCGMFLYRNKSHLKKQKGFLFRFLRISARKGI